MTKKVDRAALGPSWTEVILGAFLSAILGVILGALLLVLRPVVVAKEPPKEPARGVVYYIEGSRDPGKARQALVKRKAFADGQSVTITEDELNALAAPTSATGAPAQPAKAADKAGKAAAPASDDMLATGAVNFRIGDGKLQVGVPVTLNVLGFTPKVIVQTRGVFVKQGDMFVFEPDTIYLGSCPVERLPFLSEYVRDKFVSAQPLPEDMKASWLKLANVAIDGKTLKLTMP